FDSNGAQHQFHNGQPEGGLNNGGFNGPLVNGFSHSPSSSSQSSSRHLQAVNSNERQQQPAAGSSRANHDQAQNLNTAASEMRSNGGSASRPRQTCLLRRQNCLRMSPCMSQGCQAMFEDGNAWVSHH